MTGGASEGGLVEVGALLAVLVADAPRAAKAVLHALDGTERVRGHVLGCGKSTLEGS
ncbi:hypothetical protein SAMN04487917_1178 [Arthrobacter sp. yr096]|nr:hypothetical protein SAMN04487917_1178 [Arthrobacter sp. yr096]